ncbi:unnamed protein product [Phytophthora fragariaefolia]|uniref:Unnamed protein product n=1 Tax=Phytophthora fragariaefolia TaxID=1490495 RepID=A0A9W6X6V8_9STRA|nr:unnamed protein product [Phytophthora fragariaefolia]
MLERVYSLLFEESHEVGERLRDASLASLGADSGELLASSGRVPPKTARKQRRDGRAGERTSPREKRGSQEARTARRSASQPRVKPKRETSGGRAAGAKEELRRSRSALSATNRSRLDIVMKRADAIAASNKKRSRLLEQSFKASSTSRAEAAAKEATLRKAALGRSRGSVKATTSEHKKQKDNEQNQLKTKKYGRFVAAQGSDSSDDDKSPEDNSKANTTTGKRDVFFEGVSSVQHNSDESMHFMEDEGVFARNFSSISIEDAEPETKNGELRTEDDAEDQENSQPNENAGAKQPVPVQKSANHQEAEEEDGATSSPVKKKVARDEPHAPERSSSVHKTMPGQSKSLYRLLPKTKHAASESKAQAQYLRYKLSLKNHLQELRQRESSQRRHLERAYKSGEHMANVDKIRSRRFEQDVRLHRIAIGIEAKNEQEKQLRQAMNHLLDLEKEKLREEHRMTTSVLKQIQKEHAEREQAMENFYANQIQLVKEQTRREAKERELVEKAQRSASEKMMRELRHERENQLAALLQEKQHLEETRRFRHATQMAQLLVKTDEHSAQRTDAFYTAAMKARERHTVKKQQPQRRTSLDAYRTGSKPLKRSTRLSTSTIR